MSAPRRHRIRIALALVLGCLTPRLLAATEPAPAPSTVGVVLELNRPVHYEGSPLAVRVTIRNTGTESVENPVTSSLLEGFVVKRVDGPEFEPTGRPSQAEPERPKTLLPQSVYGGEVDLATVYPELKTRGTYEFYWSGGGLISDLVRVTVIPRYDTAKRHRARIETSQGAIVVELLPEWAPVATKALVDMARAGYFDGLQFQEVHPDGFIAGGDPRFAEAPRRAFLFPAEVSSLPLVAGAVLLKPAGASPPANSSEFIILVKPQPAWTGQVTVVGQVVEGFDVVERIARAPTAPGAFRPEPPIPMRRVTIEELAMPAATNSPG